MATYNPTPTPSSDKTIREDRDAILRSVEQVGWLTLPPTEPPKLGLFARYKAWMADKPWYYHLAAVVLVAVLGFLAKRYVPEVAPFIPDPSQVAKTPQADPAPLVVGSDVEGREKPGHRLFAKFMKNRLAAQLQKDGFASVGGDPKPLTRGRAWELVDRLDDETVVAAAVQSKAVGDGAFLDRLGNVIQWLVDHKEQILSVIKFLMTLLAVFADESPPDPA